MDLSNTAHLSIYHGGPSKYVTLAIHAHTNIDSRTGKRYYRHSIKSPWLSLLTPIDYANLNDIINAYRQQEREYNTQVTA